MISRRTFVTTSAGGLLVTPYQVGRAQESEVDYEDIAKPFPKYRLYGSQPALGPEEDKARDVLAAAPTGKTLLETARYFEQITSKNDDGHYYNAQWSTRWNPVIVGFYQSTSLDGDYVYRKGDTIDWCAAFINWCLRRGGYKRTKSAMSGSFRLAGGLGKPTTSPKAGDIIVFKKADPSEAAVGFGHVGIFIKEAPGGFKVLGGNQKAGRRYSSVNTTFFPEKSERLVFDSVRAFETIPNSRR